MRATRRRRRRSRAPSARTDGVHDRSGDQVADRDRAAERHEPQRHRRGTFVVGQVLLHHRRQCGRRHEVDEPQRGGERQRRRDRRHHREDPEEHRERQQSEIQRAWNAYYGRSEDRYLPEDRPVVMAETHGFDSPLQKGDEQNKATIIQAYWRMVAAKSMLEKCKRAAIMIQALTRGLLVRIDILVQHYAAIEIQREWRKFVSYQSMLEVKRASVIKIQSIVRVAIAMEVVAAARKEALRKVEISPIPEQLVKEYCSKGNSTRSTETMETATSSLSGSGAKATIKNSDENPFEGEADLDANALFLPSPLLSCTSRMVDKNAIDQPEHHAQIQAFESTRRSAYEPKLKSSFVKWRSSVESLEGCVREMAYAEDLVFGSLVADQAYADATHAMHSNVSVASIASSRRGSRKQKYQRQHSQNGMHGCIDIADEISVVQEELQAQVSTLSELGDAIVEELQSSESEVLEAWGKSHHRSLEHLNISLVNL